MKKPNRLIAVIMAVLMLLTVIPFTASAVDDRPGTFKCAWFNETLTYPYEYSDDYFKGSSFEYNHELATFSLCVAMSSFNSFDKKKGDEHVKAMLEECGYEVNSYGYDTEDYDTVGIAVGKKTIDDFNMLIVAVRSGNYGMEWGGNLRVGSGTGDHEGFRICRDLVIGYLNTYFKEHPCEGKTRILIPGYSRGASIANLSTAALDDGSYTEILGKEQDYIKDVEVEELYAYTFEAPQCTTNENAHDEIYSNIFNIINPNDYVPMFVMNEWGFTHYGIRVEMPCADNCDNYNSYYERVCKEFDSFMKENKRKAKNCFYTKEDSRSVQTTLNYIFTHIGSDVMYNREYFHDCYEDTLVFFAGQYLGKKRTIKEFAGTTGKIILATVTGLAPKNLDKIKSGSYRKYLSEYLAARNGGELSEEQIENTFMLLSELMKFINANRKEVISLVDQLHTVAEVHQPYIALSWMRTLNGDDIQAINGDFAPVLRLSCTSMTLKYDVHGTIVPRFDKNLGKVEWKSENPKIAAIDEYGVVHSTGTGTTVITASLCDMGGTQIVQQQVKVTVKKSVLQNVTGFFDKTFGKKKT